MPKPLTIEARCNRFPPVACRLLARKKKATGGVEPMSDLEIASAAGMSVPEVCTLSRKTSWMDVPLSKLLAFSRACGIDFDSRDSMRLHSAHLNQSSMGYLRKQPDWPTKWKPLLMIHLNGE